MKKKVSFIAMLALAGIIGLGAYWMKCRLDVDVFDDFRLSDRFPFKYFTKGGVIKSPKDGVLIFDSFDDEGMFSDWAALWMREREMVIKTYDICEINNSRCLMIHSKSSKEWSYSYSKIIQVQKGDVFRLEGYIKASGQGVKAAIGVDSLDHNKKTIKYGFFRNRAEKSEGWTKVDSRIVISEDMKYIRFRLYGSGTGNSWFEDVRLSKLENIARR